MPKVSVVIPNYNHARFLDRRIRSVLEQTYRDIEVLILDDASPDDSLSVISKYAADSRARVFPSEVNSGCVFKQWNKGVRMAQGDYIWIAESDDDAEPTLLEALVARLDSDPKASLAYCRSMVINERDEKRGCAFGYLAHLSRRDWSQSFSMDGPRLIREALGSANLIPNASSAVFRKDAYVGCGGADEGFRFFGDWDLWLKLAARGTVSYQAEFLNLYRRHSASFTSKAPVLFAYGWYERLKIFRRVLDGGLLSARNQFRQSMSLARELFDVIHYAGLSPEHQTGLVNAAWDASSLLGLMLSTKNRWHQGKQQFKSLGREFQ